MSILDAIMTDSPSQAAARDSFRRSQARKPLPDANRSTDRPTTFVGMTRDGLACYADALGSGCNATE